MRRAAFLATSILLMLAALADPAQAVQTKRYPPPPEGWGAAIWHTAEVVWGGPPPLCATVTVEFDRAPIHHVGRAGEATRPIRPQTKCFARLAALPGRSEYLCNVTLHEYGHLMGEGHTSDPTALMFGDPWAQEVSWDYAGHPACWKYGHWQRWQSYLASELAAGD